LLSFQTEIGPRIVAQRLFFAKRDLMADDAGKAAIIHDPILVDLALQGGGSHGAFTWGVLDRLLEEPWLGIDGISGTSAGAMNAAVLVDGHPELPGSCQRCRLSRCTAT
jgi:predicted acylesterase/phospholipase RssA